ncbi:hypothetical protein CFC21_090779 [Triticum aestivum]|uniref:Nucleolar protein 58/56 N-terminal domain-containing protein n=2 Tax=Triticum aestivum TaxID=4565 RepID=A0A3B6QAE9_WHEAT|nr:hypothetical protein CFC21_090779 [Triticum aestivum]
MDQRIGSARSPATRRPRSFDLDAPPPPAIAKQLRSSFMMGEPLWVWVRFGGAFSAFTQFGSESTDSCSSNDRLMLLLFETPSGFAIFNFVAEVIEKPNALENTPELQEHLMKKKKGLEVVWLRNFRTFEDKSSAINQNTGVNESLTEMIMKCHFPGQRIAVGKPEYKKIIEESLKITCVYSPAVMELMWGVHIWMPSLVPREKFDLTEDERLPMSYGLKQVLSRYDCDYVNPEMLDQPIIITSYALFECDSLEEEKSDELDFLAAVIKVVSGIDTEGWGSLKIATALKKIWCPEEADNSCEIISEDEVSRLVNDADKYEP